MGTGAVTLFALVLPREAGWKTTEDRLLYDENARPLVFADKAQASKYAAAERITCEILPLNDCDVVDVQIAVRMIECDYRSAMREARDGLHWLRSAIDEAERNGLDAAFSPGNMGSTVAKIEAARWKAKALKEALRALGRRPTEEAQ